MRSWRSSLTVFAAALYVLLGISAAWHAPHFSRGDAAIDVDAHSGHEAALDGDSCALCSSKLSAQEFVVAAGVAPWSRSEGRAPSLRAPSVASSVDGLFRARAPPALS